MADTSAAREAQFEEVVNVLVKHAEGNFDNTDTSSLTNVHLAAVLRKIADRLDPHFAATREKAWADAHKEPVAKKAEPVKPAEAPKKAEAVHVSTAKAYDWDAKSR